MLPALRDRLAGLGLLQVAAGVAFLALLARLALLAGGPGDPTPDTPFYAAVADGLLYGLDHPGAHSLDTLRPPGYPLFLALVKALPGGWTNAAGATQLVLGIGLAVAVTAVGWRYFGRAAGVLAGVMAALSPVLIQTERYLTPDLVTGALMLAGAVLLAEAVGRDAPSDRLLIAAGAVFGLAAYLKPSAAALAAAGVIPLAVCTGNVRATLRGSAIVAVAAVIVFTPWIVRNWVVYDYANLSPVGGPTLFRQAFDQTNLAVPTDSPEGRFVEGVRRDALEGTTSQVTPTDFTVHRALRRQGRSYEEAADVQRDLAMTAIRRDPGPYLRSAFENVRTLFDGVGDASFPREILEDHVREQSVGPLRGLGRGLWHVGSALGEIWTRLAAGGLFMLLLPFVRDRQRRAAGAALLSVWLVNAAFTGLTTWPSLGDFRFAGQGAPVALTGGSAAIVLVLGAVVSRLRVKAD